MGKSAGYIKAKIKTQGQIAMVHPPAVYWGKPLGDRRYFRGADEVVLKFVGKTISVKKMRSGLDEFYFEIKDSGGLVLLPNWIAYFDSEHLVPPADWSDYYNPSLVNDIWLNGETCRISMIENILIITG